MKLCDTCIYRNNVEQLKPCIIYRDDCEYYEREEDMKAIIQIDVPDYQIGQEVSIYFKDTMMIKGIVQESSGDLISRQAVYEVLDSMLDDSSDSKRNQLVSLDSIVDEIAELPSVNPQEPKTGHWIEKDGFDGDVYYDCSECGESWATIEGTPWDNEWDYCPSCGARMVEPQESEGVE